MMDDIKKVEDANVLADSDGKGIVSLEERHFVVLRECSLRELHEIFEEFREETCEFLSDLFVKTPKELKEWLGGTKYELDPSLCPPKSAVGLKIMSQDAMKLGWLDHSTVVKAAIELGEIDADLVGSNGMRMKKGTGRFHELMWAKSLKKQRAVIQHAFDPRKKDLSELTKKIQQGSCFDFEELKEELRKAKSTVGYLRILASGFLRDLGRKKRGTNIARCWFAIYLAREGVWLFPRVEKKRFKDLTPRLLWRFIWDIAVPNEAKSAASKMYINNDHSNEAGSLNAAHCEFLLRTNLYHDFSGIDEFVFYALKGTETASLFKTFNKDHRLTSLNLFFGRMLNANGEVRSDREELAAYYGGGGRIKKSKVPFSWMRDGKTAKPAKNSVREKALSQWGGVCPPHVYNWIEELELAVRLSRRRSKTALVQSLNYWVYFMLSLDKADCPLSFIDIDRFKHIKNEDENVSTFLNYIQHISINQQERAVITLYQSWMLVVGERNIGNRKTCPIDHNDIPRAQAYWRERGLGFRTNRKSLGAEKHQLITEENRRANEQGQPFAFARKFCGKSNAPIYFRNVTNQETGQRERAFFPVAPVYLDVLLNTGMRSHSGRWLDSGEGDEYWVDRKSMTEVRNPLPTAKKHRAEGFLRLHDVETGKSVLGMYLPVSKTGPQSVPWIDEKTAEYVELMREWQIKYNPQGKPVTAVDDLLDKNFSTEGGLAEIYPLFRDPRNEGKPPGYGTLSDYFYGLLKHCEEIYNEKKREQLGDDFIWDPFFIDGSPKWTLHSLRVTLVTTLMDAGVPASILQVLTGHKSLVMTYHYAAIDNAATYSHIRMGMEARRQSLIDAALNCESPEDADQILQTAMGGVITSLESGHCGAEMFRAAFEKNGDRDFTVFSHGICPGGDCGSGGEISGTKAKGVFRPQACSRCRYRITGPAFLNGLVLRLNQLMLEITDSFERERNLEDARLDIRDSRKNSRLIDAKINSHREAQEELFAEWAAELLTIKKCQSAMESAEDDQRLPVIAGLENVEFGTHLTEGHKLTLLQSILSDVEAIDGIELEVPDYICAQRNEILLRIAEENDAEQFFYSLPRRQRDRALNEFGKLFIEHQEMVDNRGSDLIDEMIAGTSRGKGKVLELVKAIVSYQDNEEESLQISVSTDGG